MPILKTMPRWYKKKIGNHEGPLSFLLWECSFLNFNKLRWNLIFFLTSLWGKRVFIISNMSTKNLLVQSYNTKDLNWVLGILWAVRVPGILLTEDFNPSGCTIEVVHPFYSPRPKVCFCKCGINMQVISYYLIYHNLPHLLNKVNSTQNLSGFVFLW